MAVETLVPLDIPPHRAFANAWEALDEKNLHPADFHYHAHVPVVSGLERETEMLRQILLGLPYDITVSRLFPPQGPHINYPYFSAYFPGMVRAFVISRLLEANVPSMVHPVTGLQYAEHQEPLAIFLGKRGFPHDAHDLDFLRRYDEQRGVSIEVPRLACR